MSKINVKGNEITIISHNNGDYISLTDMVRNTENNHVIIGNWLRKKDTVEYLGIWERLNNPNFKLIDFDEFRINAGSNRFALSPKQWIEKTDSIGILSKSGRYGGTYAHKDIAFHFAMWLSPEFQLIIVKEFQRLKEEENKHQNLQWDYRRFLSKVNYRIHTDAVKENIIPTHPNLSPEKEAYVYANEAEILNVSVFGITSKQWREDNPKEDQQGFNIRDLANIPQLTVLANLENLNAHLISEGNSPKERFEKLKIASIKQLKSLSNYSFAYPIESPNSSETNTFNSVQEKALEYNLK